MARLVALTDGERGPEYVLGELCIIGRSPNAHIQLSDRAVSRQHAKITRQEGGFVLEDLDSSRGTVVNGLAVTVSRLRTGDEIHIAGKSFRFLDPALESVPTADYSLNLDSSSSLQARELPSPTPLTQPLPDRITAEQLLARSEKRLRALLAVGQLTCSDADPEATLKEIMEFCLELFPTADRALVAVPDREKRTLAIRALTLREHITQRRFHVSRAILSEVLTAGRPLVRGPGILDSVESTHLGPPMMLAPLMVRGQKLGLIYVDSLTEGKSFTRDDLELLTGLACHAAQLLNTAQLNATLLRQSRNEQEVDAARQVQKHFLPRGVPKMPGFSFVAHYDPCQNVGGDLYDFIQLDPSRVGIVVGDVAGKGFPAALVMAWVTSQIRQAAHQEKRPEAVVARVNASLLEARQDHLFVTLMYGVLDRWTMNLHFCNAGHLPPLIYRGDVGTVETVEEGAGLPVGLVADASFEEARVQLGPGDTALFATDGITEAKSPAAELFGMERLRQAMTRGATSAQGMVADVLTDMRAFVAGQQQSDDITMVALGVGSNPEDIHTTLPPGVRVGDF